MRELAVQAANETNTDDDKESIQDEIESLKKKLTVYPPIQSLIKTLLWKSRYQSVWGSCFENFRIRCVAAGKYNLRSMRAQHRQYLAVRWSAAVTTPSYVDDNGIRLTNLDAIPDDAAGIVVINGREVGEAGDTATEIYGKLREGAELGECSINP